MQWVDMVTKDFDLYAYPSHDNQEKIAEVMDELGYDTAPLKERPLDSIEPIRLTNYQCGKIEILTHLQEQDPDGLFKRSENTEYRGINIKVISYNDLVVTKLEALRGRDIDDVERLEKQRKYEGAENQRLSEFLNQYYQQGKENVKKQFNISREPKQAENQKEKSKAPDKQQSQKSDKNRRKNIGKDKGTDM